MTKFTIITVLVFSFLSMTVVVAQNATAAVPKDKSFTAILHIFQGSDNKAVIISRGKLPDTVGSPLVLVTDLSSVNATTPKFVLNGQGFGATGGGQLGNKTKTYSAPADALTVDLEDCADINLVLPFVNKENNPLKLFGIIDGGAYVVLPNIPKKKVGDLLEGKATVEDVDGTGLSEVFDKVPDGTSCTVSWKNGKGKKQTLKLIIGKNLRTVNTVIGISVAIIAGTGALTMFYLSQIGK